MLFRSLASDGAHLDAGSQLSKKVLAPGPRGNDITLAVRLGMRGARIEYLMLLGMAFAAPPTLFATGLASAWVILAWLSLPLAERQARIVVTQSGAALNNALAGTAMLTFVFSLLFAAGLTVQ